jgi:hypothetical protein
MTTVRQTGWYGGIADDPRAAQFYRGNFLVDSYQTTKHFDLFTNAGRLTPYRSLSADTNDGSTSTGMKQYVIKDYVYASASAKLYGLGQTGVGLTQIAYKADATNGNWTVSSAGTGAVINGCFVEYKDYLWGFQGTTSVFKWGLLSGSPAITNAAFTVGTTITSVANGLVFQDYLYLPYNNKIARMTDAATFSDAFLTLPTNYKITSLAPYGKYIAIACAPVSVYNGSSKVLIWDGTSPDVQETVDWGEGQLMVLDTIEGMLVGVTDRYLNNSTGAGRGSMIIQTYSGGSPIVVKEIFTQALTGKTIPQSKTVKNNRLFFAAKIMTDSAGASYNEGIWSFGRKASGYPFTLTLDYIDENINTNGIQAFGSAANYFFITHSNDGSIDKTSSTATYSFTSIFETQVLNLGSSNQDKRLNSVRVDFSKIVTGTFILKYKVDGATSWVTIGTYSTVGDYSHTFLRNETADSDFLSGREFQFRLESTGGLEITGLTLDFETYSNP